MASFAYGEIDEPRFFQDVRELAAFPSRVPGTAGYEQAAGYIEQQLHALPNVEYRVHTYDLMVPVTRSATLTTAEGKSEKIYPFWPAVVRVNSTPAEGLKGKLIYVGNAGLDSLRPGDLAGQIAVMETSAGAMWMQAPSFGARAVILLGGKESNNVELRQQELNVPINIPRFFLPAGATAEAIRRGQMTDAVTLRSVVEWKQVTARNFYALVKGTGGASGEPEHPAALMFAVPFDSSSVVPDLAPGASQAVQAAAGLALLRDLSRKPLDRPVVVYFGGGDSVEFQATRQMFMALSDVPAMWRDQLEKLRPKEQEVADALQRVKQVLPDPTQIDLGRDHRLMDRIGKIIETDAADDQDELFRLRELRAQEQTPDVTRRVAELEQQQIFLNRLRFAFQQRPKDLTGEMGQSAQKYLQRAIVRLAGRMNSDGTMTGGLRQQYGARRKTLEDRISLYEWLARRLGRNINPDARTNDSRLIELMVALDLSDGNARCGPMYWGQFLRISAINQIQNFRDWFSRKERAAENGGKDDAWFAALKSAVNFEPFSSTQLPQSYLTASMPIGSEMGQVWGVPAFSMATLDDLRLYRDTPNDTVDRLNIATIVPQLKAVRTLFWHAWNDPKFKGPVELKWQRTQFEGQVVSPAAGRPVPDLPREGFLVTTIPVSNINKKIPPVRNTIPYAMGIRRSEIQPCDAEGNYLFEGLCRIDTTVGREVEQVAVEAYRLGPDGAITATTDLGKGVGDIKLCIDVRLEVVPVHSVVFNCTEVALAGLYDPRFLQELAEVVPLDARRNAEPQRYNFLVCSQLCAGFVEPGANSYLLFRYGRVGNRLILINMPAVSKQDESSSEDRAVGYTPEQLKSIGPLALATARDFWRLDEGRLRQYARAGVSSPLIDSMHAQAAEQIEQASGELAANRGRDVVRDANGAWANEARVYSAAQDMARDVIRAAIFLLLLCVPFSFCMERLLIGSPSVYRQIGGVCGIFSVMTIALWSFHPAFKISSSPLIIILAFAIIFMSAVVISVVYGKFDTELKRIRSGRVGSIEGASFASSSVLMSAVLLGIANMRKRRFRTVLTSLTIVLITFAVLCFTSASRYLDTATLPTGIASQYAGVMLRQRGFRPMPELVLDNLQAVLGGRQLVQRWWNVNASDPKDQIHIIADRSAATFSAAGLLGLSPGESAIGPLAEVIGHEQFGRLERGERDIIYFCSAVANTLKVKEGDYVHVGGMRLQVAGVFDADAFDQRATTLGGEPITPLKYSSGLLDTGGRKLDDNAVESLDLDAGASESEASNSYEHLSATQIAIVPAAISQLLPNVSLRSMALRLDVDQEGLESLSGKELVQIAEQEGIAVDNPDLPDRAAMVKAMLARQKGPRFKNRAAVEDRIVKHVSDELSKRFAVALFAGFSDGVRMVAASNLSSVSGAGQVAIPLAIAGLIIFNTMMGSIAERKREIHIYTSLGLAPMHVGALFLAEALTYGLIGTVFGYVIGQGVGTLLLKMGWLGNVTLNYSGTSAILTMGLILLIVLLSALVPARLASKIAAPSIERTWKVPLPKGDEIMTHLPFTINKTAADGALAYLADYFDAHREGSIGKFSAGKVEAFTIPEDGKTASSHGLKMVVWLTPFDLGVRQHLMLLIHPGQFEDIYEVQVVLQRLSGDDGSWYRMNRTFLTELRKQFLQWRTLTPARMMEYVEESKRLFTYETQNVVTTLGAGEQVRLA